MNLIKQWWADHGTKILGGIAVVLSVLEVIDRSTIDMIGTALGPLWTPIVVRVINLGIGIATIRRGFINTRNKP